MVKLRQVFIGYVLQTFGAGILSLIFIKFLYSLGLAEGLCWTTDCEINSTAIIISFYSIIVFVNLYIIILPVLSKSSIIYLSILIFTLIIQIYTSTQGDNYAFATILFSLMGILNYQQITKNINLKLWESIIAGLTMLMITLLMCLTLTDILIGYLGIQNNPNKENLIKIFINSFMAGLIICISWFTYYKIKNK